MGKFGCAIGTSYPDNPKIPSVVGIDEYLTPEPGSQVQQLHANSTNLAGKGAIAANHQATLLSPILE